MGREMESGRICICPHCKAGPLTHGSSGTFLLWQNFHSLGNPTVKTWRVKKPERGGSIWTLKLSHAFSTSLPSSAGKSPWGRAVLSSAKGWERRCRFRHKFTSPAGCSAGQSGFHVPLGGELVKCFLFSAWVSLPEKCEIQSAFVNRCPCRGTWRTFETLKIWCLQAYNHPMAID